MHFAPRVLFGTTGLISLVFAGPIDHPYTLTVYAPGNATLHGLKAQNGGSLFQERVSQYCPTFVNPCPNGTETVYSGLLNPASLVPGGQSLYVSSAGSILITVQHSHEIPLDAYPSYQGWTWNPLHPEGDMCHGLGHNCPIHDLRYSCAWPSGYWTFRAPSDSEDYKGGVVVCSGPDGTEARAVTPHFNVTGCIPIAGLGTHRYTGTFPPVWAY